MFAKDRVQRPAAWPDDPPAEAGDGPGVPAALVARLLPLLPGHPAVVPLTESGYHPLCAVHSRDVHHVVARCLSQGSLDTRTLLHALTVRALAGPDLGRPRPSARLFANVNTAQDHWAIDAHFTNHASYHEPHA